MKLSVQMHDVKAATNREVDDWNFSTVKIENGAGGVVVYLPKGKSQAVADAINAAIAKDATE